MNFLVTGGAGFIGYHLCERLLRDGQAVWAFDDLDNFYDPKIKEANLRDLQSLAKPFTFVHGDLTDRAGLDQLLSSVKFDQIIHLAARAGVRPSLLEPSLYQRVNVEGTVNLLEAARLNGVNLDRWGGYRHHDRRLAFEPLRSERDALGMVARGGRHHAT